MSITIHFTILSAVIITLFRFFLLLFCFILSTLIFILHFHHYSFTVIFFSLCIMFIFFCQEIRYFHCRKPQNLLQYASASFGDKVGEEEVRSHSSKAVRERSRSIDRSTLQALHCGLTRCRRVLAVNGSTTTWGRLLQIVT